MTASDDKILEFLANTDAAHNYRGIEANIKHRGGSISYTTVKRRMPKLEQAGLVTEIEAEGSYYRITEDGRAYLRGDLDATEIDL